MLFQIYLITGDDPGNKLKPDPLMYKKAIKHFGAKVNDCIVFEDSPEGAYSAFSAGIEVIDINQVKQNQNINILLNIIPTSVEDIKDKEENSSFE